MSSSLVIIAKDESLSICIYSYNSLITEEKEKRILFYSCIVTQTVLISMHKSQEHVKLDHYLSQADHETAVNNSSYSIQLLIRNEGCEPIPDSSPSRLSLFTYTTQKNEPISQFVCWLLTINTLSYKRNAYISLFKKVTNCSVAKMNSLMLLTTLLATVLAVTLGQHYVGQHNTNLTWSSWC